MRISNILFVCVGNVCRSCVAEKIFQDRSKSDETLRAKSAGLSALVGEGVHPRMCDLLESNNINNLEHSAQNVDADLLKWADIILVMEAFHKSKLVDMSLSVSGKCFLLSHWTDGQGIVDPYGRDSECFSLVYQKILLCVDSWLLRLMRA